MISIFALVGGPAMGDAMGSLVSAASLKLQYKDAKLVVYPLTKTKTSDLIFKLCPYIDYIIDKNLTPLPLDFIAECDRGSYKLLPAEVQLWIRFARVVMLPDMYFNQDHVLDRAVMSFPDDLAEDLEKRLIGLGLDPGGWFACVHAREDGYRYGRNHPRSITRPERYWEAVKHIMVNQGGQVVRMGDPAMTPFPKVDGLVDLSHEPDSFLLQTYALSRARYLLGSDSGPGNLAKGFNKAYGSANHLIMTDNINFHCSCLPNNHCLATKIFHLDDGRIVRDREAFEAGVTNERSWRGKLDGLEELPVEDLIRLVDIMHHSTNDLSPWEAGELAEPLENALSGLEEQALPDFSTSSFKINYMSDHPGVPAIPIKKEAGPAFPSIERIAAEFRAPSVNFGSDPLWLNGVMSERLLKLDDAKLVHAWESARESQTKGPLGLGFKGWHHLLYGDASVGKKVLVFGSGSGVDGVALAEKGANVFFADSVKSNLALTNRLMKLKNLEPVNLLHFSQVDDLFDLPRDFDMIISVGVLNRAPVEQVKPFLDELVAHLKTGGRFLVHAYPRSRWEKDGSPEFESWGKMTDGPHAGWTEWLDTEKMLTWLAPARFEPVLYTEYQDGLRNLMDLIHVDRAPDFMPRPPEDARLIQGALNQIVTPQGAKTKIVREGNGFRFTTEATPLSPALALPFKAASLNLSEKDQIFIGLRTRVISGRLIFALVSGGGRMSQSLTLDPSRLPRELWLTGPAAGDLEALLIMNGSGFARESEGVLYETVLRAAPEESEEKI